MTYRSEPIDESTRVRVLVVDDSRSDLALIKAALSKTINLRCDVSPAASVLTARMALKNRAFDVILLDLGLPDMQGIDAVVEVRKVAPSTPIVVLSGNADVTVARNAQHAGADGYLTKGRGFDPRELEREIARVIHEHHRETQRRQLRVRTRARISDAPPTGAETSKLCEPHLATVEAAIDGICAYVARNAPAHLGPVRAIIDGAGTSVAIQELRALLEVEAAPRGEARRPISVKAMAAVMAGKRDADVDSRATADAAILDLIS